MNNSELMKILDARDYLLEKLACFSLLQSSVLYDIIEQLSPTCVFHDKIELLRSLDNLVKLYDIRMPYHLEDLDLS